MEQPRHPDEQATPIPDGAARTRTLATAGIVGPALFTVGVLMQQFYRRGTYDPTAQLISDLTAGPYGWVQQANFIVFGLLVIAFAVGLHRRVRPARAGVAGPALVGFNGLGLIVGGLFPLREDATGGIYDPLGVHVANGRVFFLGLGVALTVVSLRLRSDPRWRGLAAYTLGTGFALLLMVVAVIALAGPAGGPLHDWLGVAQRLVLVVWLSCVLVLALRLRRLAGVPPPNPKTAHG